MIKIKYKLDITAHGRIIIFQKRQVRTPVSLIVTKKQLHQIKIQLHRLGVTKEYSIHEIEQPDNIEDLPKSIVLNNEQNLYTDQLSVPEIEELLGMEKKKWNKLKLLEKQDK